MTTDRSQRVTTVKAAIAALSLVVAAASLVTLASLSPTPGDASGRDDGRVTLERSPLGR